MHLTNHGPLVCELEDKLKDFFQAPYFSFLANGTLALQIAIKALDLKGEIITTPFSYVATTSSIVWENCTPVFVDIEPDTLTLDPSKIEAAITEQTSAILATHVYGIPCDVLEIERIAKKHSLKVIYDAAHCFAVTYQGKSITAYGDISALSFHATKLFHTVEGGGLISHDAKTATKIDYLKNFGHDGRENFNGVGINAKNSELHAAMGLCNLPYVNDYIAGRKMISELYDAILLAQNVGLKRVKMREGTGYNYAYYPVIFPSEKALLQVVHELGKKQVMPRRYFYPSLSNLNYVPPSSVPVSEDIASRILCLPLHHLLAEADAKMIAETVVKSISPSQLYSLTGSKETCSSGGAPDDSRKQ